VNLDFEIDQDKTIRFTNRDPIPEIEYALENFQFNPSDTG
jgi:hypothetical protein